MSKTVDIDMGKPPLSPSPMPEVYRPMSAPPVYTSQAQLDNSAEMKESTVWYVLSVLATICCCLPFGVIGMVHAMVARHDGELGRVGPQRARLRKAKAYTCISFGFGLLGYALLITWMVMACRYYGPTVHSWSGEIDEPQADYLYDSKPTVDAQLWATPAPVPIIDDWFPWMEPDSSEERTSGEDDGDDDREEEREGGRRDGHGGPHGGGHGTGGRGRPGGTGGRGRPGHSGGARGRIDRK